MKPFSFFYIIIPCILFTSLSCEKDPQITNPEELITTLAFRLTPISGAGTQVLYLFRDIDGDGGLAPVITAVGIGGGDSLVTGSVYSGSVEIFNDSTLPGINITDEIEAEAEDHQFFYTINGLHASIEYADQDDNGFPVGLMTTLSAAGPGNGSIVITLRHQPDKDAAGVSDGDIQHAGGETDIQVSFPVTIVP